MRKENPSQTLSDLTVDFYDVRPQRRDALSGGRGRAILNCCPGVAELADALDSKSSGT